MRYVDGFVIAVPTASKQAFIEQAHEFDTELEPMTFDGRRLIFRGFTPVVEL